jgi:acetoin utilization protein AcuC
LAQEPAPENCSTSLIYHPMYDGRGFSRINRSWERYRLGMDKFSKLGFIRPGSPDHPFEYDPATFRPDLDAPFLPVVCSREATEAELLTVHSPEHIRHVREMDAQGSGMFDRNDTPAWPGVYRRAALAVGGTLVGAELIGSGQVKHVFHGAGGLHHAHYDRASGFCIFNDIVAAVRFWQKNYGYERIAILDVDGHHGDGTQALLYQEKILKVSLHHYDGRFFPKTGALGERGSGAGWGYSVNLPLPRFSTDEEYLPLLEIAFEQIEAYQPQAIIMQYGTDAHFADRMTGLKISTRAYEQISEGIHELAHRVCEGRLLVVGGGGYEPEVVSRCWAILVANLTGRRAGLGSRYRDLYDDPTRLPEQAPEAVSEVARLLQVVKQML